MFELTEKEKFILKEEFPNLSISNDDDIERYFFLRHRGKEAEAIELYNKKLKAKYPNDKLRIALLSAYRKKDPSFKVLLKLALKALARNKLFHIKAIINFFSLKLSNVNPNNIMLLVRQCEAIISIISNDKYVALPFIEKHAKYAKYFNFKENEMKKVQKLIHLYITGRLSYIPSQYDERKQDKKDEEEKLFDFSKVHFTKKQKAFILISSSITRLEDKVIAYILKYLPICQDPSFENLILLYSKKYNTKHYNIFKSIQKCVNSKERDAELLHIVLTEVTDGYYYSVAGDLYLQHKWKALYSSMMQEKEIHASSKLNKKKETPKRKIEKDGIASKKDINTLHSNEVPKVQEVKVDKEDLSSAKPKNVKPPSNEDIKNLESIKDIIKRITKDKYSIYKELFFKSVRISIRHIL